MIANANEESQDFETSYWNAMIHPNPTMQPPHIHQYPQPHHLPFDPPDPTQIHFFQNDGFPGNFGGLYDFDFPLACEQSLRDDNHPTPLNSSAAFDSRSSNPGLSTTSSPSETNRDCHACTPDSSSVNFCYGTDCATQACAQQDCGAIDGYDRVECTEPSCQLLNPTCGGDMPIEDVQAATYLQAAPATNPWPYEDPFQPAQFNSMSSNDGTFWANPNNHFAGLQEAAHDSLFPQLNTMKPYLGGLDGDADHRPKRQRGTENLEGQPTSFTRPVMNTHPSTGLEDENLICNWYNCRHPIFDSHIARDKHVHDDHFHPQLKSPCTQTDCAGFEGQDYGTHQKRKHGRIADNDFCEYANCVTFNPDADEPLEQHRDQEHSTPVGNGLFCGWKDCPSPKFNTPRELAMHMPEHNVNMYLDHQCKWKNEGSSNICGERFRTPRELQEHTKEAHLASLSKKLGYICRWEGCDRASKTEESKQAFAQRGKLERHMQSHTQFKACVCPICLNEFSAAQALEQHMRKHDGKKPFACDHPGCGKAFAQASALTMHKRTHTGEKPLKCDQCGKCFAESSNLSKHKKTHNPVGQYKCEVVGCGKTFHRPEQLKRHKEKHAKEDAKERGRTNGSELGMVPVPA